MALLSPPFTSSSYLYCSPHPFRFTAQGSSASTAHHSRLPPISTAHSFYRRSLSGSISSYQSIFNPLRLRNPAKRDGLEATGAK
ncbi:hypothetical protein YC2023_034402 [Brassica napus]|uniref:Uncharacterized protein n=1 Tax=Brassica oleracea TaxID=3712 RepID=A0A3P6A8V0_BRAOL|nr:unnamed protein product [Brassica oleracea]